MTSTSSSETRSVADQPGDPEPRSAPRTAIEPGASPRGPRGPGGPRGPRRTDDATPPFSAAVSTAADRTDPGGLPAGTLVGKYQLVELIGGGGMGVVYRAVNPDLKLPIALKMIRAGDLARPEDVQRFLLECEA